MSILSVDQISPIGSGTTITLNATEVKTGTEITVGPGASIFSPAGNTLTFGTNNEERIRIKNNGSVLIGDTNDGNAFSGGQSIVIGNTNSGTRTGVTLVSANDQDGGIYFSDGTSSGNANVQGQIVYNHSSSYFSFYTAASERLRINSGGQVLIGTATAPAYTNRRLTVYDSTNSGTCSLEIRGSSSGDSRLYFTSSTTAGQLGAYAGKVYYSHADNVMAFYTAGAERLKIASNGNLILNATTGGSVALLKAGGGNTDLRLASVGSGGFLDVQTNGVNNRIKVDANGHFYTNSERTRLTYGAASACSLRWNITSGKNLTQNNANRDNYGKLNIQAGRANSTTVNDDCTAIRITPAEVRSTTTSTKSCGIGFQHLNADTWPQYSGNQVWMGLSIHDTPGQERDKFEIHMNSGTGLGSQPNKLAMRLHPDGEMTRPNLPMFFGMGANGSYPGSSWYNIRPASIAFDTSGGHISSGTYDGGYEVPVDGTYMCIMNGLVYVLGENQFAQSRWHKNGSQYGQVIQFNGNTGNHTNHNHTVLMECSAGDKINQQIWTNSGGAYSSQWHFIVYLVG